MDPITTAIIAAAAAGVASSAGEVGQQAVRDAYNGLKVLLKQKFGAGDLVEAVDKVEQKPDSEGRRAMLQEEVATAQAYQDPELKQAAETLLAQMEQEPQLAHYVKQIAVGNYIAQASHGGTASINVNAKED